MTPERGRAINVVYECLMACGLMVLNDKDYAEQWALYIGHNLCAILDWDALLEDEQRALHERVSIPPKQEPGNGIAKWAAEQTGVLLGHGKNWHRKQREKHELIRGAEGRMTRSDSKRIETHPGEFDLFTRFERRFLMLPVEAQNLILEAVRLAMKSETPVRFRGKRKEFEAALKRRWPEGVTESQGPPMFVGAIQGYFLRDAEDRDDPLAGQKLIPRELKRVIATTISKMRPRLKARVHSIVRRRYPGDGKCNGHLKVLWPIPRLGAPKRSTR